MTALQSSRLDCDLCGDSITWAFHVSAVVMRRAARENGWRRDKAGRDICQAHLKLKGARR